MERFLQNPQSHPSLSTVAILTLHFNYNYGAFLQAYSLSNYLTSKGFSVVFPSFIPEYMRGMRQPWRGLGIKRTRSVTKLASSIATRLRTSPRRKAFDKERNSLLKEVYTAEPNEILSIPNLTAIAVGSDQVWNTRYMPHFDGYHFLSFVPKDSGIKKVAVAPCFGQPEQKAEILTAATPFIARFDHLSARNQVSKEIIERQTSRPVSMIGDPALLFDHAGMPLDTTGLHSSSDHTWVYMIDPTLVPLADAVLQETRADRAGKLVHFASETCDRIRTRALPVRNAPPSAWISSLISSRCVVTDSFHGVVLSLIFGKPFIVVTNAHRRHRISHLLEPCAMSHRIVSGRQDTALGGLLRGVTDCERHQTGVELQRLRTATQNYLSDSLCDQSR